MKSDMSEPLLSKVIGMAWADDVSFEKIKSDTGLSESDVIAIMRRHLKANSYVLWRKRVKGRKSKHAKKAKLFLG